MLQPLDQFITNISLLTLGFQRSKAENNPGVKAILKNYPDTSLSMSGGIELWFNDSAVKSLR